MRDFDGESMLAGRQRQPGCAAPRWTRRRAPRQPAWPEGEGEREVDLDLTWHGRCRMAQRSLSGRQLAYVLEHAVRVNRTGVEFYVLRRRDVAPVDRRNDAYAKVAGAVVLV